MIPHYWVTNMFAPSGSFYCSEDSVDNIVVMAILESCIAPRQVDEAYQTALKRGAEILRSCTALTQLIRLSHHERSEFERPELTSFTQQLFLEIAEMSPQILTANNAQTPEQAQLEEIEQIVSILTT